MISLNGTPLSTHLRKGKGLHAFHGFVTAEAAPVPGLTELMLLEVNRDRGAHILHLLFSVPVGPYDPDRRLFGSCEELPTYVRS